MLASSLITLAALGLSACTTNIPVRTQIEIDAPRSTVFAVLTDFERYPDWNPYHIHVAVEDSGPIRVGAPLEVTVRRPDGVVVEVPHVEVLAFERDRLLVWGGGLSGIFRGEHVFRLEDGANAGTRLIHDETFSGLFVGFADLPPAVLTAGYEGMNRALKAHVEAGRPAGERSAGAQ